MARFKHHPTATVGLCRVDGCLYPRYIIQAVVRARFCESLARTAGLESQSDQLFLMGLFSLLDAILDRPLPEIVEELPIVDDVKHALMNGHNRLRDVYDYVLAYERGNWDGLAEQMISLDPTAPTTPAIYMDSVEWANQFFGRSPST